MKVLVTGGTGNVGSKVISELLKRNVAVRALVRKQEADKVPVAVETVVGDLLDPVSVEKALQGVDKAYLLNAVVPDELTQGLIVFDLAKRRKARPSCVSLGFQGRSVQGRAAFRVQTGDRERIAGV